MLHSSTLQSTRPFQAAEINRRYARCLVLNQNWTSQPEVRARLPGQLRRPSDAFYIPQMAPGGVCTDATFYMSQTAPWVRAAMRYFDVARHWTKKIEPHLKRCNLARHPGP